jgi:hypothetical protein
MKNRTLIITLAVAAALISAGRLNAQYRSETTKSERNAQDSTESASLRQAQVEQTKDDNRMADAKLDRKHTKANAKNAQRNEKDANAAARESRYAVRTERRAQKARKQANKQSKKAADAINKSDRN